MFVSKTNHYHDWMISRFNGIKKCIPNDFFENKTLLELGGGHGVNANNFRGLGAIVTTSDAREEHLEVVKEKFPDMKYFKFDCDKEVLNKKYDIILHWGVLYHLKEIENHLENVCKNCDVLLLESEVSDSDNDKFYIQTNEHGGDQAYNSIGIRPSPSYVERVLKNNGFNYRMITDKIINSGMHIYNWKIQNRHNWRNGQRRYWICWNKDFNMKFNDYNLNYHIIV